MKEILDAILDAACVALGAGEGGLYVRLDRGDNGKSSLYFARVIVHGEDVAPFVSGAQIDPHDALRALARQIADTMSKKHDELAGRAKSYEATIERLRARTRDA